MGLGAVWKQIFQATWKAYKTRFDDLIRGIRRHSDLIVNQATLSQIETSQDERKLRDKQFLDQGEVENSRRRRELTGWLRSANVQNDQHDYSKLRAEYPGTGRWLLENQSFKDWFKPLCQSIPPVLWLNGIPGAGELSMATRLGGGLTFNRKDYSGFNGR